MKAVRVAVLTQLRLLFLNRDPGKPQTVYWIGKAVFRIFKFYAKQPIQTHGGFKCGDKQGHCLYFMMKTVKTHNFPLWSNLVVLL